MLSTTPQDATYACVVSLSDSLGARDLINVSILARSDNGTTLRLTAWTEETHHDHFGPVDISDRVIQNASALAARCGGGPMTVWSDTART